MMDQIKIIKLDNGDDIVCNFPKEQLEEKSPLLRIEKPLQIKYISQLTTEGLKDYIALIKWAAYTNDKIITIPKSKIMTITNATGIMCKNYSEIANKYDKIEVPTKEKKTAISMNKKENDEFNELWDEFRDLDDGSDTIH